MPRVENIGNNVTQWHETQARGNGSSTFDVCRLCAKKLEANPHEFDSKLVPYNGDPPGDQGRGHEDVGHPSYEEHPTKCEVCKRILTSLDE